MTAVPLPAVPVEPESEAVCECGPELAILCGSVVPPFVKYLYVLPEPEPTLYEPLDAVCVCAPPPEVIVTVPLDSVWL